MPAGTQTTSKGMLWTGRILSGLIALFMLMDGLAKILKANAAIKGTAELGFSTDLVPVIGVIALLCAVLYAIPQTSMLGAVLLTGYLGGAVVVQLRVGHPLFSQTLFPIYFGVLLWGGLFLRDARVRALLPWRSATPAE